MRGQPEAHCFTCKRRPNPVAFEGNDPDADEKKRTALELGEKLMKGESIGGA